TAYHLEVAAAALAIPRSNRRTIDKAKSRRGSDVSNPEPGGAERCRDPKKQAPVQDLSRRLSSRRLGGAGCRPRPAPSSPSSSRSSPCSPPLSTITGRLPSSLSSTSPSHNERNEDRIVKSHAVPHLVELLRSKKNNLRELATAAVLTLSASTPNKPTIATSGAVPLLVQILIAGSI
ncbi:unnamed protein product, partial [Musa textilis]